MHLSASRQLVMEMMVLAGEVAAKFGHDKGAPMPFRHQPAPSLPPSAVLNRMPSEYARGFAMRRAMVKSGIVTDKPLKHHGLGVDAYVQVCLCYSIENVKTEQVP